MVIEVLDTQYEPHDVEQFAFEKKWMIGRRFDAEFDSRWDRYRVNLNEEASRHHPGGPRVREWFLTKRQVKVVTPLSLIQEQL